MEKMLKLKTEFVQQPNVTTSEPLSQFDEDKFFSDVAEMVDEVVDNFKAMKKLTVVGPSLKQVYI